MQSRPGRINTSKPVNINISFTINPKNVLNQAASYSHIYSASLRPASRGKSLRGDLCSRQRHQIFRQLSAPWSLNQS